MAELSVIIPTRSRPAALACCLEALAASQGPLPPWEVVVVDDGSPIPDTASPPAGLDLRWVRQEHAGPARARNRGAATARGKVLVFLDDDCRPEGDWLSRLWRTVLDHPQAAAGGRMRNALPGNLFSRHGQLLIDYLYSRFNPDPQSCGFLASSNLALPAVDFLELGGFCEEFPLAAGEDRDFCHRWRLSGRRLVYAPAAVVWHAHAYTLTSFLRQHYNYGRGARQFHRAAARSPEPAGFYLGLLQAALPGRLWLPMLLSQAAHTVGYLAEGF